MILNSACTLFTLMACLHAATILVLGPPALSLAAFWIVWFTSRSAARSAS